jgi:hypothetical protein
VAAARRLDPHLREAIFSEARREHPEIQTPEQMIGAGEVVPTTLDVTIVYVPGLSNRRNLSVVSRTADDHTRTW